MGVTVPQKRVLAAEIGRLQLKRQYGQSTVTLQIVRGTLIPSCRKPSWHKDIIIQRKKSNYAKSKMVAAAVLKI
jgi:hypothetical protein